ncbi:hypothetical protein RN001_013304 [Aquatica leii]|uniref:Uncharacterized protein n=1 Tax=Aquatica leii TaxID=1421715 RepID=A0AAN7SDT6_9COLE|nr:hypothetical protein RN001_013304 [Aquatica leii]
MANRLHVSVKRSLSESDINSSDNESNFNVDDSILDKEYHPSDSLIATLWLQLVREHKLKSIEHRFLVSAHSYLPCDRDFFQIEKHKRFFRQIHCPEDWYEAVRKSNRTSSFEVIAMEQKDFLSFKKVSMVRKNLIEDKQPITFSKTRCFRFESGKPNTMLIEHEINRF